MWLDLELCSHGEDFGGELEGIYGQWPLVSYKEHEACRMATDFSSNFVIFDTTVYDTIIKERNS